MSGLVRTIIADDHAFIRQGLKQLLSTVEKRRTVKPFTGC
jgi:DNA-binding NarL/FixJ family response regulator